MGYVHIKNVQRVATRLVASIKHLPYKQRLEKLALPSLRYRRQGGDMICLQFAQQHL